MVRELGVCTAGSRPQGAACTTRRPSLQIAHRLQGLASLGVHLDLRAGDGGLGQSGHEALEPGSQLSSPLGLPLKEAYKVESELAKLVFHSEDAKEGPRAFAEKRDPKWSGK